MVNFSRCFIPVVAGIMQPLFAALKGKPKSVTWTPEMDEAFSHTKEALMNATMLVHPRPQATTALTVDASDIAVGGVLEQYIEGGWKPLAFFSKQLQPNQRKYIAFDRELMALHMTIRHFRYFLEGRVFTAYTDHKPLIFAFAEILDPWSARQQRQLAAISEYTTDVQHITGICNVFADALSRCQVSSLQSPQQGLDYSAMGTAQQEDE